MKIRNVRVFAVVAILVAFSIFSPSPADAQTKSAPQPVIPPSVVQAVNTINAAYPGIATGASGIQQAQATQDPAAVVEATASAISQATGAASTVPGPVAGYLAMASIIAGLFATIFGLFKKNQASDASVQAAHTTAQAAMATAQSAHVTTQAVLAANSKT